MKWQTGDMKYHIGTHPAHHTLSWEARLTTHMYGKSLRLD